MDCNADFAIRGLHPAGSLIANMSCPLCRSTLALGPNFVMCAKGHKFMPQSRGEFTYYFWDERF